VNVRYGGTAELAVLILEEGRASPADVFWGQDAGALGALSLAGRLSALPGDLTATSPDLRQPQRPLGRHQRPRPGAGLQPRAHRGHALAGVGVRPDRPGYRGRVAWAPTNGSFQAFVTAMRVVHGEAPPRRGCAA
jgi:iron(III) transport system substrate-binding protein